MKIVNERPPIYDKAEEVFGPIPENVVFAYGDTIYVPIGSTRLSEDVIHHEEVHERQQDGDPADWWEKYLADPEFRLDQELEAYRAQYEFICRHANNRQERYKHLMFFAQSLSGPIYGNLMTVGEALTLIQL